MKKRVLILIILIVMGFTKDLVLSQEKQEEGMRPYSYYPPEVKVRVEVLSSLLRGDVPAIKKQSKRNEWVEFKREDTRFLYISIASSSSWLWFAWKDNNNLYYIEKDYLICFNIYSKTKRRVFKLSNKDYDIKKTPIYSSQDKKFFMIGERKKTTLSSQQSSQFIGLIFDTQKLFFKVKRISLPKTPYSKNYIFLNGEIYAYYEEEGIIWKERLKDNKRTPLFIIKDLLSPHEKDTYEIWYSLSNDLKKIAYVKGKSLSEDELVDSGAGPTWKKGIWICDGKTNKMINEDCITESLPKWSPDGSMIGYWLWKEIEPNKSWGIEHILSRGRLVLCDIITGEQKILCYTDSLPTESCWFFVPPFAISPDNSKTCAYTYFNICHKMPLNAIKGENICWHKEDNFNINLIDDKKIMSYPVFTTTPYKDNTFLIFLPPPIFSPDSKKIAFYSKSYSRKDKNKGIWIIEEGGK